MRYQLITALLFFSFAQLFAASEKKMQAIYNSLDEQSLTQHLAFYELYKEHPLGRQAMEVAWQLMHGKKVKAHLPFKTDAIQGIISLVNKRAEVETPLLDTETIDAIDSITDHFFNRRKKGHVAKTEEEVIALPPEEVDLCRGLLLSEFGDNWQKIRSYEAMIDLMAMQILARLPKGASDREKVAAINQFVFEEQGYRFPPHSLYAKEIDEYTFLPSVLDSRRGVCLGVSILYLCFAERIGLPLEIVTPPGHIYVRCPIEDGVINIETTARGIDIETELYLGVATKKLQMRNIKEVIGLAHFNKASGLWQHEDYEGALRAYKKAEKYLPDDILLRELIGYTYLFAGEKEKGMLLLKEAAEAPSEFHVYKETIAEDYVKGHVDIAGIQAVMMPVDETRDSLLKKCQELQGVVERFPHFRAGLFSLASTWLQLHRTKEAVELLTKYSLMAPEDPKAHYYLSILSYERLDDNAAWSHLHAAEELVTKAGLSPKPLKQLRKQLSGRSPE